MNNNTTYYGKGNRAAARVAWLAKMAILRAIHEENKGKTPRFSFGSSED